MLIAPPDFGSATPKGSTNIKLFAPRSTSHLKLSKFELNSTKAVFIQSGHPMQYVDKGLGKASNRK